MTEVDEEFYKKLLKDEESTIEAERRASTVYLGIILILAVVVLVLLVALAEAHGYKVLYL